uniref:non-specific serine/threonine protein kinase n=1 Tax=Parastrongyloides trichosuri TaxID=131310 RepID=A0A0N4ZNL3_PARTI
MATTPIHSANLKANVPTFIQKLKSTKSAHPAYDELVGRRIKGWKIKEIIGKGTYGFIYKCTKRTRNKSGREIREYAALKAECITNKNPSSMNKEACILNSLKKSSQQKCTPFFADIFEYGEKTKFTYMITTLFGPNLFDILVSMPNKKIEERTWVRVIMNVLEGLKILHKRKFIHLDLKPANIVIDHNAVRKQTDVVAHIIDFGLARKLSYHSNEPKGNLEPDVLRTELEEPIWVGSIYHCSPFIHRGYLPTYRDDIYSWLYVAMDLYKELPWTPADTEQEIVKKKFESTEGQLKKYLPPELGNIIGKVMNCGVYDKPDYDGIYLCLKQFMTIKSIAWNEPCEWEPILQKQYLEKEKEEQQQTIRKTVDIVKEQLMDTIPNSEVLIPSNKATTPEMQNKNSERVVVSKKEQIKKESGGVNLNNSMK